MSKFNEIEDMNADKVNTNNRKKGNSNKKEKKSIKLGNVIMTIILLVIGGICGFYAGELMFKTSSKSDNIGLDILKLAGFLVCIYLTIYIQIIIHEGGHYIFGRLTGYKFVSFRIGKWMLVRAKSKFKLKKFHIVGTGGQCLMMPPDGDGYHFPCILYNLGGVFINVLSALLSYLLMLVLPSIVLVDLFLACNVVIGISFALINGIPMHLGGIANDGSNALSLRKDSKASHYFWLQLHINGLLAAGTRMRDMNEEWFEMPMDADFNNPLIAALIGFRCSYFHDIKDFEQAKKECEFGLNKVPGMIEIYKNELGCELLFYEIMDNNMKEVERLYTKQLKKYIKATSMYVTRKRLMYAYELLVNKNEAQANKVLKDFEKVATSYPYEAEVESEREVLELIKSKSEEMVLV